MGRKYSPTYADIYLAHWEETVTQILPIKPLLYFRYLDNIFGLWNNTQENFLEFFNILNTHHPKIKLKYNLQTFTVEFLDIRVFFAESGGQSKTLATKVYFKDTDRHALLHKTSYHPKHTYRGLIKSQLIRFHRICTFPGDVEEATCTLFGALRSRGYSGRFLRGVRVEVNSSINKYKSDKANPARPSDPTLVPMKRQIDKWVLSIPMLSAMPVPMTPPLSLYSIGKLD
ncbi:hypothetical protein D5F01_LYC22294 [Larimichthys crocea]|uniref:Helix-turn-helix domain-containing protein n=1 Tax=Larimichthys crocea TaxID=215358 RepID=A0A6G0HM90_LARCR|nr:hypothetical protein D5F01_LYC22294 [Larimichthys crocea]